MNKRKSHSEEPEGLGLSVESSSAGSQESGLFVLHFTDVLRKFSLLIGFLALELVVLLDSFIIGFEFV